MSDITPSPQSTTIEDRAEPGAGKTDDELFKEAIDRFKIADEAWTANHKSYEAAIRFRNLDQWPEKIKKWREDANRPCLVVDKINQYIRQVVNDGRQNRPGIKVHPVDDGNEEVAEAYEGIIRKICRSSNADDAFDTALDCAAGGGFGFFRVVTEYLHENTFNQEIRIKRVRNPTTVLMDPNIQEADGSDAMYAFVISEMPKEQFKRKYPNAKLTNWESDIGKYSTGWINGENVQFAEYFYVDEEPGELHLLADGTSIRDDEYQEVMKNAPPEVQAQAPQIVETRVVPLRSVKWCRLSGAEILEKNDWLGKYIPIVPIFGNEFDVDGKVYYSGLTQPAMDAMRMHNFAASAGAEALALQPKAPYVAAAGQVESHSEWEDANTENYSVLKYDPVDVNGTALPPPGRQQPPVFPSGFAQLLQLTEHDIQGAMGMYAADVGQPSNEKSGKAIMARQRAGDVATFHYQDNLNRGVRQLGRILVDLIPRVIDSKRVVRILHEDGTTHAVTVDPNAQQPVLKLGSEIIYNLNSGQYDMSVESGPSYTTKRSEALDAGMQLLQANPAAWQLVGDIVVRNADWPGASEMADRMKLMLPPQVQQMENQQQPIPPEIQQALQQVQQGQQQLTMAHQQLMQIQQQVGAEQAQNEAEKAKLDAARKELEYANKLLMSQYQELSAKLELQATKAMQQVPPVMPQGKNEPAIQPDTSPPPPEEPMGAMAMPPPTQPQAPSGAFFTPGGQ